MNRYIKGKGILVGTFSMDDLDAGKDTEAVMAAEEETGLRYTNTELVRSKGNIVGLRVYVCTLDDMKI